VSGIACSNETRSISHRTGRTDLGLHRAARPRGDQPAGEIAHCPEVVRTRLIRPRRSALRPLHAHAQAAQEVLRKGQDRRRRQQGAVRRGAVRRVEARRGDTARLGTQRHRGAETPRASRTRTQAGVGAGDERSVVEKMFVRGCVRERRRCRMGWDEEGDICR
jgi:hypothetical protein